jgi:hypothetical protein
LDSKSPSHPLLPGEDLLDCHGQNGAEKSVVNGQENAHSSGDTEDPLAIGQGGQDLVNQVRRCAAHAPRCARWTEASALAGKRDEPFIGTLGALHTDKAAAQPSAVQVLLELTLDEGRVPKAVLAALLSGLEASLEVSMDDLVQGRFLGIAALVRRRAGRLLESAGMP